MHFYGHRIRLIIALAAAVAAKFFGPWGLVVEIFVMVVLLVSFGEVLPMTLAVEHPAAN